MFLVFQRKDLQNTYPYISGMHPGRLREYPGLLRTGLVLDWIWNGLEKEKDLEKEGVWGRENGSLLGWPHPWLLCASVFLLLFLLLLKVNTKPQTLPLRQNQTGRPA